MARVVVDGEILEIDLPASTGSVLKAAGLWEGRYDLFDVARRVTVPEVTAPGEYVSARISTY